MVHLLHFINIAKIFLNTILDNGHCYSTSYKQKKEKGVFEFGLWSSSELYKTDSIL